MKIMYVAILSCMLVARVVDAASVHKLAPYGLFQERFLLRSNSINKYNFTEENDINYWRKQGCRYVSDKISTPVSNNGAKNIIMFLGDGMSIATITAARILLGQNKGLAGENSKLSFETFPYTGLSKTYCVDWQVGDSACTATAYLRGFKGNAFTIGVSAAVPYGNCDKAMDPKNRGTSILEWAQNAGKGTGIVTTTRVTHASPAGTYAYTSDRNFESDFDIKSSFFENKDKCVDIAKQLVYDNPGRNIKVILGGGRSKFLPKETADPEDAKVRGERLDGVNLIETWTQLKTKTKFVWNKEDLFNIDVNSTDYLLGLFEPDHMKYHLEKGSEKDPTLEEMTKVAIKMLQKEKNGYFLFVEGGRIDHSHHDNFAQRALDETVELHKAVQAAVDMTDIKDTLIVVTADHAHTMTVNGHAFRGDDILAGITASVPFAGGESYYTTLSYANGPANRTHNPYDKDISKNNHRYPALVKLAHESHGGEDVAVYARGPGSQLFTGTMEQNVIALAMGEAAGIGP